MAIVHFALAVRDVRRAARFFESTLLWQPIDRPDNIALASAWLEIAPGQEVHLLEVADYSPSPFEREYGRHIAVSAPKAQFPMLKQRLQDHGAEVFKACVACHTLSEKDGQRAGPTLAGLYGRKIATLPDYHFSEALKHMDIVWTPETVSKLFEVGPNAYTPGTKMPEQRIGSAEDRKALTDFLARATSK